MNAITPIPAAAQAAFSDTRNPGFTPTQACTDIPADNDALIAAITTLAGHINAAQHRFLTLLAALVEREARGDGGGMLVIRGRLTPEDGAVLIKALDRAFA